MKKILLILLSLFLVSCSQSKSDDIKVAVSIVPQQAFVEAVAGDLVDVKVMIPPGYSPANYQPSPKEMAHLDEAAIYFHIDVAAEMNIVDGINSDKIKLVDLAEAVDGVYPARFFEDDHEEDDHDEDVDHDEDADHDHDEDADHDEDDHEAGDLEEHDHDHSGRDPHIWLSPRRVIVMVNTIKDELILLDPDNKATYEENAVAYIKEIEALDQEIKAALEDTKTKTFLIYHPSYGYFADDYGLNMVAIEDEGKEATIQGMEFIIELAKEKDIHVIFYQEEFDSQQAEIIAKEIDGVTIQVAPLSGDYIESLKHMVTELKNILN